MDYHGLYTTLVCRKKLTYERRMVDIGVGENLSLTGLGQPSARKHDGGEAKVLSR